MDYVSSSRDMVRKIFENTSVSDILNGMLVNEKWKEWLNEESLWKSLLEDRNMATLLTYKDMTSPLEIDGFKVSRVINYVKTHVEKLQNVKTNYYKTFMFIWTMLPHIYVASYPDFNYINAYKFIRFDPSVFFSYPYEFGLFAKYSYFHIEEVLSDYVIPELSISNLQKGNIAYIHFDYNENDGLHLKDINKLSTKKFPSLLVTQRIFERWRGKGPVPKNRQLEYKNLPSFILRISTGKDYDLFSSHELDALNFDIDLQSFKLDVEHVPGVNQPDTYSTNEIDYIFVITTFKMHFNIEKRNILLLHKQRNRSGYFYGSVQIPYYIHFGEGLKRLNNKM